MSEFVWQVFVCSLIQISAVLASVGAVGLPGLAIEPIETSATEATSTGSQLSGQPTLFSESDLTSARDLLLQPDGQPVSLTASFRTTIIPELLHPEEAARLSEEAPSLLPFVELNLDGLIESEPQSLFTSLEIDRLERDNARTLQIQSTESIAPIGSETPADWNAITAQLTWTGETTAQLPLTQAPAAAPAASMPSTALNILVLRSLRKPVGNRVLDTGVQSAGIRPRAPGNDFWTRDFLTGYWDGTRTSLYQNGIDVYLIYFAEVYSNASGGLQQDTAYNSVAVGGIDFYSERMGWWRGGQLHITAAWLEGVSVARDYAGALNSSYFGDPIEHGPRLFEFWYGQRFADNRGEIRIGKIYPFVRIAPSQVAGLFTNGSFAYPTFLGTTQNSLGGPGGGLGATYPVAPLGIQLSYSFTPEWSVIGQIQDGYDDPSGGTENRSGLNNRYTDEEGIEGIVELVHRLNQAPNATGLPGNYRIGVQFHTGEFFDNHENETGGSLAIEGGDAESHRGNAAFYLVADQMLIQESPRFGRTQGLSAFFKTVVAPNQDINTVAFNIAGGLAYEGPIPGRDRDVVGLAASYTRISSGVRDYYRDLGETRDGETVIELAYAAELAPWWIIVASLQQIIHPNGDPDISDATVLGISSRFSF